MGNQKKLKPERKKFIGSNGWLWFWIIMCFPVAVIYWAVNREYPSKIKYE